MTISLKPSTAGIQYAGWTPTARAEEGLGNRVLASQQVPVDGAVLNADVYLPKTPGRYPAVVSFGGYETETHTAGVPTGSNEIGSPPVFTDRGYAPVIVERRGMGRSTGEALALFGPQDVDDHEAVIAWAAAQPWCNGEVVLFGTSYYAVTQLFVAARRPQALKALFANEVCTDLLRHLIAFGNVPGSFFLGLWMGANFTEAQENLRIAPNARALASHLTNGPAHALLEKGVHRNVEKLFASFLEKTPAAFYRQTYASWVFDEKTRADSTAAEVTRAMLAAIDVPVVTVQNTGYLNLHQFGSYDVWDFVGSAEKYLILAPHAYDLPVFSWQGEALAFFDHVLRGTDNGYAEQPPVRYWVDGADAFAPAPTFPPAGTERRLYLGDGLSETPTEPGQKQWAAVPFGTPVLPGLDEEAPQTVGFDLPITSNRTFAGAVTANLSFSCNEIDSYVLARLSRVDADGTAHLLSMGAIRPITRRVDPTRGNSCEIALDADVREPLVPGEKVLLRFSLTPAPVRLRAGETLRLDLGSRTDLLRGKVGDGYVHFDMPVPPYLCRNSVHLGGESWIEVTEV
jgi:uncharacterized protein